MNLRRRFVNLVAKNILSSVGSLHRLDVSQHLFYPSTAEAEAAKPEVFSLASLPAPICNFQPAMVRRYVEPHIFGLANPRISESRILWRSQEGNTFLYDADSHTAWSMPSGLRYMGKRPRNTIQRIPAERYLSAASILCAWTHRDSCQSISLLVFNVYCFSRNRICHACGTCLFFIRLHPGSPTTRRVGPAWFLSIQIQTQQLVGRLRSPRLCAPPPQSSYAFGGASAASFLRIPNSALQQMKNLRPRFHSMATVSLRAGSLQ